MSIIPNCSVLSPSGDTPQDHFNALFDFFVNDAVHWSVIDSVVDGGDAESLLIEQGDQQILMKMVFGDFRIQLDPAGDRSDVDDPASSESANQLEGVIPGSYSNDRAIVSELEDAFFWGIYDDNNEFFEWAIHAGVVYSPLNEDDDGLGMTGHGVYIGRPQFSTAFFGDAWSSGSTAGTHRSRIRVSTEYWDQTSPLVQQDTNGGFIDGIRRLAPIAIKTNGGSDAPDTDSGVPFAFTRYVRQSFSNRPAKTILPSATSDQGWLYLGYRAANDPLVIPWDRTVIP